MAVTTVEVRRWLYRYIQSHSGWFGTDAWKVAGDEYIPALSRSLERVAEYVASLSPTDAGLVAMADALNDSEALPDKLEQTIYPHITGSFGSDVSKHPSPEEFLGSYVPYAVGAIRAHRRRRS